MFRHFLKYLLSRGAFVFSSSKPHTLKHFPTSNVLYVQGIDRIKRTLVIAFLHWYQSTFINLWFCWWLKFDVHNDVVESLDKLTCLQYCMPLTDKTCFMTIYLVIHIMGWDFLSDRRCNSLAIKCIICHIKLA